MQILSLNEVGRSPNEVGSIAAAALPFLENKARQGGSQFRPQCHSSTSFVLKIIYL